MGAIFSKRQYSLMSLSNVYSCSDECGVAFNICVKGLSMVA